MMKAAAYPSIFKSRSDYLAKYETCYNDPMVRFILMLCAAQFLDAGAFPALGVVISRLKS